MGAVSKVRISIDDLDQVGACADGVRDYLKENNLKITTLELDEADLSVEWIARAFELNGYGSGDGSGYGDGDGSGYGDGYGE